MWNPNILKKQFKETASVIDFLNFSTIFLNELGVFSGFSQRKGKLSAAEFVNSCIELCRVKGWSGSLTDHCVVLHEQYGLLLEAQSLNERFTEKSEQLMRYVFDLVMRTHLRDGNPMDLLAQFEEVYVEDSTNLELPHCLHTLYKGVARSLYGWTKNRCNLWFTLGESRPDVPSWRRFRYLAGCSGDEKGCSTAERFGLF
ncbi:MAG: hypothetical protein IPO07_05330 [Haliscomenobacter sp.]|nr:hypothetical protein [Haliscomenobacter sp.]MBK9488267.1 hypothetical protein [Haliscomenobacter sp.]